MMKRSMIGAAIGIAVFLFSVNAMAAGVLDAFFPANSGSMGEPAILLLNGALMIGLGITIRKRHNTSIHG